MNQQETIEKLVRILSAVNTVGNPIVDKNIAIAFYNAGLRFIPDELPILTDEEIKEALNIRFASRTDIERLRKLAVAERDLCQKVVWGG